MAADRVPAKGHVWVMRHPVYRERNRGRVTIEVDPVDVAGRVVVRYHGSGAVGEFPTVDDFVRGYDFLAIDEATAVAKYGPQVRHGERRLVDMPISLGTAVK